jgi:hypothetical protein
MWAMYKEVQELFNDGVSRKRSAIRAELMLSSRSRLKVSPPRTMLTSHTSLLRRQLWQPSNRPSRQSHIPVGRGRLLPRRLYVPPLTALTQTSAIRAATSGSTPCLYLRVCRAVFRNHSRCRGREDIGGSHCRWRDAIGGSEGVAARVRLDADAACAGGKDGERAIVRLGRAQGEARSRLRRHGKGCCGRHVIRWGGIADPRQCGSR